MPEKPPRNGLKAAELQLGLTHFPLAARSINPGEDAARIVGRFGALRRLRHPNLSRFLDILVGRDRIVFLATEHSSRTLADELREHGKGFEDVQVGSITVQVVAALCHLNAHGLVHGHLDAEAVLFAESGVALLSQYVGAEESSASSDKGERRGQRGVLLTGHSIGHLVGHGRFADFCPLKPGDLSCLAPELVPSGLFSPSETTVDHASEQRPSCKPDVWSLGILMLQMLQGPWEAPQASSELHPDSALPSLAITETAVDLWRFVVSAANDHQSVSAAALLGGSSADSESVADSLQLATGARQIDGDTPLGRTELSYRQWLSGRSSSCGTHDLRDLWMACLTVHPAHRPRPLDVASHPALAGFSSSAGTFVASGTASSEEQLRNASSPRWTGLSALHSERVNIVGKDDLLKVFKERSCDGANASPEATSDENPDPCAPPMHYLRRVGIQIEDLHYWWNLAGGDAFEFLAEKFLLRPAPAALRLPLYVRDTGENNQGTVVEYLGTGGGRMSQQDAERCSLQLEVQLQRQTDEQLQTSASLALSSSLSAKGGSSEQKIVDRDAERQGVPARAMGFWEPPSNFRPQTVGVDLHNFCLAVAAAERLGPTAGSDTALRPQSLYARLRHFGYQRLRVKHFERLLARLPRSRPELFQEAAEDIPPLLRSRVWSALLGGAQDSFSDHCCWALFYEQLLAMPLLPSAPVGSGDPEEIKGASGYPAASHSGRSAVASHSLGLGSSNVGSMARDGRLQVALRSMPAGSAIPRKDQREAQVQGDGQPHELLSHPEGRRQLERLVHAILAANPGLTQPEGLAALCTPLVAAFADNEASAFMAAQRLLHGSLWHLYSGSDAGGSCCQRRQCLQLFGALLGFADPQVSQHLQDLGMQPNVYAGDWLPTWFAQLFPMSQALLLWDALLLRPPQFPVFVGVCLIHFFREALLSMDEASHVHSFLASCAQLVDCQILVRASVALFQAVPASVTLPVYPRHSAGEALLWETGSTAVAAMDPEWVGSAPSAPEASPEAEAVAAERLQLVQHATEQWHQCEWWLRRVAATPTPPIITVDDLLSFRSRCFVLDVRCQEDFAQGHFQASIHVRDPKDGVLPVVLPQELIKACGTPARSAVPAETPSSNLATSASNAMNMSEAHASSTVVVGGPSLGAASAAGSAGASSEIGSCSGGVGNGTFSAPAGGVGHCEAADNLEAAPPWLFTSAASTAALRLKLVVVVGGQGDFGVSFAERLLAEGVRHVVCLLGGVAALQADAPRYLVVGSE
ncbi:unnamed protein product [Polarella glacialis]|uniref:TBC1 domain family member 23 n=1 Tax=Polarella glacialis TaxID=89957 RepID=A0A813IW61_POLGL|nr:unnamed protein product [Polarella glacialis]